MLKVMINEFMFGMRTKIIFENGCIKKTGEAVAELNCKKVLLVSDKGVRATDIVKKIKKSLSAAGVSVVDFDGFVANPRISECETGAKLGKREKVDCVVAVGGGSSIDAAKAISGMLGHGTTDFNVIRNPNAYTKNALPTVAVPTTAGTGSEVTPFGVVTDEEKRTKDFCYDMLCAPDTALCDPETLLELPTPIAAATGLDALTHAIEGYVAKVTSPITEAFGIYAVECLAKNLRDFIYNRNINNCEGMMLGSMMAGLSFGYSDTGAVHSLSEVIGGEYDTPHGVANAIFLADVSEFSLPAAVEKYARIAEAMGVGKGSKTQYETAQAGIQEIRNLVCDLQIPKFNELEKINPADFERLAYKCSLHTSLINNPRFIEESDFLMLLKQAYER